MPEKDIILVKKVNPLETLTFYLYLKFNEISTHAYIKTSILCPLYEEKPVAFSLLLPLDHIALQTSNRLRSVQITATFNVFHIFHVNNMNSTIVIPFMISFSTCDRKTFASPT